MCIVGNVNGTRCRDGVKVLWCHSHLVRLVFLGFHPYMHLFSFRKLFVTCSCYFFCCLFVLLFRNGKREERWEGRPRGRRMVYKVDNVHIQLRIIINLPENPSITLFFYLYGGLEARAKPQAS